MKKLSHPYLLWAIVIGGGSWWLSGAYRLYLLGGFNSYVKYTLLSGLPVVGIGVYLLFAIYAVRMKQRSEEESSAQERKIEEGVWPPPPTGPA